LGIGIDLLYQNTRQVDVEEAQANFDQVKGYAPKVRLF
jgi:hypothetical protein